jgi:hypothetical protein
MQFNSVRILKNPSKLFMWTECSAAKYKYIFVNGYFVVEKRTDDNA